MSAPDVRFLYPVREIVTSYIEGRWQPPGAQRLPVINPANRRQVAQVSEADADETHAAVCAAQRAFDDGRWANASVARRQEVLRRVVALTREHLDELAWLETLNSGLPLRYLRTQQMPRILRNFAFFADALTQDTEASAAQNGFLRFVLREPVGVAALISPWNAPLALASTKIAAALAFGNTCVVKTAEQTPLAVGRFMEILSEAGVPPGVVNLVNGRGHVTGDALVRDPLVRMISFTGGTATGQRIAEAAAPQLKRVDLELGGKSANIITTSADFDRALDGALASIYTNNGQQCFAGSRILVQRAVADRFMESFIARARRIRIGDPTDSTSDIGPLANAAHHARALSFVDIARAEGAEVLTGGRCPPGLTEGFYFEPTLVRVHGNGGRVCQEEIFAPFATLQVFDEFDEAIALANDCRFGLASYLWSSDLGQCMRAAREIQAGVVLVNTPMNLDLRFPFGGYKESGLGREGLEGFRHFYTQEKTVTIALEPPTIVRLGLP